MALYNERVYSYERMQALHQVIDEHPEKAGQMVTNDNSNHLAFLELSEYEKKGRFLYLHPILKDYKQENELEALRRADPERFTTELVNSNKSITRYKSLINKNKYKNNEELTRWQAIVDDYEHKLSIMKKLIGQ